VKGIKKTRQGYSSWDDVFVQVPNKGNRKVWTIQGTVNMKDKDDSYDLNALSNGWISVTPLGVHFDLSHNGDYEKSIEALDKWSMFKLDL